MKIAWITNNINQLGGVEQVICGLSSHFSGVLQHKVEIISIHSSESHLRYPLDDSVQIRHCSVDWRGLGFRKLSAVIGGIMRKLDADILLTCHSTISFAVLMNKRKFKGKIVVTQHGTCDIYSKKRLYCNAALFRLADQFVVLTDSDREQYRKLGCPAMVIPNANYISSATRSSLDQKLILAAGRMEHEKGFDRLIEAFAMISAKYPEWKLCICGDGSLAAQLKSQIESLGLSEQVLLPGSVKNMPDYYQKASIYALSSRAEGFALVSLEAISFGLPVVSFDLPSVRELFGKDSEFIVPQDDISAFSQKLEALISDAALRKSVGDNTFETSKKYSIPEISERWMQLFHNLSN